jgi:hypothetical protein
MSVPTADHSVEAPKVLLAKATIRKVEFMPDPKFSSRQGLKNCLRLSFA